MRGGLTFEEAAESRLFNLRGKARRDKLASVRCVDECSCTARLHGGPGERSLFDLSVGRKLNLLGSIISSLLLSLLD